MEDILIRLSDVGIGYDRSFLKGIYFEMRRGEFWGMVGPNGAGKTTLAKTILKLIPPVSGMVEYGVSGLRLSYTPQRHRLNPNYPLSALDVVLMGRAAYLSMGRRPNKADKLRAEEELSRLDIHTLSGKLFRTLSGGQQQRVLLARALAVDPDILVLDEPAEGMDLLGTHDILGFLKTVNTHSRMSVLMISHHIDDVISSVDHLCFINQYSGLFESGTTQDMASSTKLTSLYGRTVETHTCAGKTHVHVEEV